MKNLFEKYYDLNDIGEFPERLPPINVKSDIDNKYEYLKKMCKNYCQ